MSPVESRARRISKNTFFLSLGELISRLFAWLTILYIAHRWTAVASYGQYATAINWITLFVAFSDLGFNVLTIREVSHRKEKTEFYLRYVIGLKFTFAVVFYAVIVAAGWVLDYEPVLRWAMAVIGLRLFMEASSAAYTYVLQAHEMMVYQGMITVASATLRMLGIVLVVSLGGGVVAACWVWVIDSLLASVLLLWIGWKKGWRPRFQSFRWKEGLQVLSAGIPLAAFGTFQMLYNRFDAILLKSFSGNEAVAYYDLASRLLFFVLLPSNLFSLSVLPVLSSLRDKIVDFRRVSARSLKILIVLGAPMTVGGFLLADPLIHLVYPASYSPAASAFAALSIYVVIYYAIRTPVNILSVREPSKLVLIYSALFLANAGINLVLIPRWGYMGAAWASVGCGVLELLFCLWGARPYFGGIWKLPFLWSLLACFLAAGTMGVGIHFDPRLYWLLLGPLVYGMALWLFGVLDKDDWNSLRSIIRMKKA